MKELPNNEECEQVQSAPSSPPPPPETATEAVNIDHEDNVVADVYDLEEAFPRPIP